MHHINATDKAVAGAGCGDSGGPLFLLENRELVQVGIASYALGGRDHFTRVFTYMNWINNVLKSPPTQSQMVHPRCFNSCCDDPDHLDSYARARPGRVMIVLLIRSKLDCWRIVLQLACNVPYARLQTQHVVDGYLDAEGYTCSSWTGYDCTNYPGYSSAELADVQSNCPNSCGVCSPGTDCTNNEGWLDEKGYDCHSWQGYDCSQAEIFGYTDSGEAAVLQHCPLACAMCSPLSSSTSSSASTSSHSSELNSESPDASDVSRGGKTVALVWIVFGALRSETLI